MGTQSIDEVVKENDKQHKKGAWLKPVAVIGTLLAIVLIIVIGRQMDAKLGWLIGFVIGSLILGGLVFFGFDIMRKVEIFGEDKKSSVPRAMNKEDFKKFIKNYMLINYLVNLRDIGSIRDRVINGEQVSYVKIEFSPQIQGTNEAHVFANLHYLNESNLKTNQNMIVEFNKGLAEQKISRFQNDLATTPISEGNTRHVETFDPMTNRFVRVKEKMNQEQSKPKPKEDLK